MMQNLKKNSLPFQNWDEKFNKFLPELSKISKKCILMCCFWSTYVIFELRKYREVIFDGTKNWYKIWRKIDLCFQKCHENLNLKMYDIKIYSGLPCHYTKEWNKILRGIASSLQKGHQEIDKFWPGLSKISKFAL